MYCYRVDKAKLWEVVDQVRAWYEKESAVYYLLGKYREDRTSQESWKKAHELARNQQNHVELQLFDEGESWLFRVLEQGYSFMNHYEKMEWGVHPVFYDDRSDMPEEWETNYETTEWLDDLISKGHYFMVSIVDQNRLDSYFLIR
jgi:hypothetical protein